MNWGGGRTYKYGNQNRRIYKEIYDHIDGRG